jgi:DNA-binding CsgD family transcriptional regulator
VTALTATAEQAARCGDFIRVLAGKLSAATSASDADLQASLARATSRPPLGAPPASGTVLLRAADGRVRAADVAPLSVHRHALRMGALVMVALRESRLRPGAAELLRRAYGLSAAEAAVALALVSGDSPADIADARGVSRETVRNQIKSLFVKMDVDSQIHLIRTAARLTGGLEP